MTMPPFCTSPSPSTESGSFYEKASPLIDEPNGTHKVKYHPNDEWDFEVETADRPIDLSLVLPHYRARNQPVGHRMGMFVASDSGPIKLKICRNIPRTHFFLEVQSSMSDVTIYLPSDFKGHIHHPSHRTSFSAGFTNRIMRNVSFNEEIYPDDEYHGDEVVVQTSGRVYLRMWDVNTCAPESKGKETLKRVLGCRKSNPETAIDWDFLLE